VGAAAPSGGLEHDEVIATEIARACGTSRQVRGHQIASIHKKLSVSSDPELLVLPT
jgi:hypothetical protein